jgi:tRNA1Val (adenine37-N6)-methyltransferase
MGNNYFQFKQFRICQEHTAMRVTTDACLFGAWVAERFPSSGNVLDIGAGTGLLMLMLAQKMPGKIDGIEIAENALIDAINNIDACPWKERLSLMHGDIRTYHFEYKYQLIISNPPFFQGDLKRFSEDHNMAMHGTALSLRDLANAIARLLDANGMVVVLLPPHRSDEIKQMMHEHSLFDAGELAVRHSRNHPILRNIHVFSRQSPEHIISETLDIRTPDGSYTEEFVSLLKPYYLNL